MPWGMMEKLLEKSMCNAVRRKRYLEKKNPTCYHVMMLMMVVVVVIVRVKLPASKEYLPGKLLLMFDH